MISPRINIILVGIEGGINYGLICRLAENFNINDIRLVNPRLTDEEYDLAEIFASNARDRIKKSKVFDHIDDAIKDLDIIFATSAKASYMNGSFRRRFITPEEAVKLAYEHSKNIGIVFGRESTGLTNEEIDKCDLLINIPTSEKYRALNITHSVAIILYEFYKQSTKFERKSPRYLRSMIVEYFRELSRAIFSDEAYSERAYHAFKNIINRALPDTHELKIVMNVIRKTSNMLKKYKYGKTD